jgi:hypothetical protein
MTSHNILHPNNTPRATTDHKTHDRHTALASSEVAALVLAAFDSLPTLFFLGTVVEGVRIERIAFALPLEAVFVVCVPVGDVAAAARDATLLFGEGV